MKIIRMMMLGLLICAVALASGLNSGAMFATCTGSDPCNACKNCKYCQHCAKDGGTCGVCKNRLRTQRASLRRKLSADDKDSGASESTAEILP
jgi:hypothetical protein